MRPPMPGSPRAGWPRSSPRAVDDEPQRRPEVGVLRASTPEGEPSQARRGEVLGISLLGGRGRRRVEQGAAVLGDEAGRAGDRPGGRRAWWRSSTRASSSSSRRRSSVFAGCWRKPVPSASIASCTPPRRRLSARVPEAIEVVRHVSSQQSDAEPSRSAPRRGTGGAAGRGERSRRIPRRRTLPRGRTRRMPGPRVSWSRAAAAACAPLDTTA